MNAGFLGGVGMRKELSEGFITLTNREGTVKTILVTSLALPG